MSYLEDQSAILASYLASAFDHAKRQGRRFATTLDLAIAALASRSFHERLERFCNLYLTQGYLSDRPLQLGVQELAARVEVADESLHGLPVSRELLLTVTHIESGIVLDDLPVRLDEFLEEALLLGSDTVLLAVLERMGVNVLERQRQLRDLRQVLNAEREDVPECEPEVDCFSRY